MPDVCAVPTVRIENDRASVTEWRFAAGAVPGHHCHEYAYVAVHLTTGTLATSGSAGVATASLVGRRAVLPVDRRRSTARGGESRRSLRSPYTNAKPWYPPAATRSHHSRYSGAVPL